MQAKFNRNPNSLAHFWGFAPSVQVEFETQIHSLLGFHTVLEWNGNLRTQFSLTFRFHSMLGYGKVKWKAPKTQVTLPITLKNPHN
jgi:hypothetical protein